MEKFNCPICQSELVLENKTKSKDYSCISDDHFYAHRVKENTITKLKVRFVEPNGNKLYFKINYDLGISEVWTKANDNRRTTIDTIFTPDFTDINKLKSKIKTYLVFS